jgi:GT2 family glycosyltransferase
MPDVSIVIVTYNSARHIGRCLDSIREHARAVECETVVVDNASADGTPDLVAEHYAWARLVRRATNGGLSVAVNEGVRASSGGNILALNPDTRLLSDAPAMLAACLREHAGAGIVAPKLLDPGGAVQLSCRRFPSYSQALFSRYSLLTRLFPSNRRSREYLMADFDHAAAREVDWVSGAAMMFPREVFDRLGGWDAGFFMFNEDVDFCRRAHDAGYRVVYCPDATIEHAIGVSRRAPLRIVIERHRSMWRYYRKHMRGKRARDAATAAGIAARCLFAVASSVVAGVAQRRRGGAP